MSLIKNSKSIGYIRDLVKGQEATYTIAIYRSTMRFFPITLYLRHLPNRIMLSVGAFLNIGVWAWLVWQIRPQDEFIFLHYNVLFGVDRIGPWWHVFSVPLLGTVLLVANALVGWYFFEKEKLVSYLLLATTIIAHMFLAVGAYLLVFLNV